MPEDIEESEERRSPSSRIVHDAVLKEGREELARPTSALAWSGLAAGLSMGFSFVAQGLLQHYLPDAPWRPLVSKFGYCLGFVLVILGRQQLFTENTLTPILPLLEKKDGAPVINVARLWLVVLVTNLIGGLIFAAVVTKTDVFESSLREALYAIARESISPPFEQTFLRGIFAGWLIALIVWLLPFAEAARFWVIVLLTYFIGVGHLSHVIAGSIEVFALAFSGQISWASAFGAYTVPSLLGNMVGGVTLVALINHAQVVSGRKE